MHRSPSLPPAVSTAAAAYHVLLTRGPPTGSGQAPEGNGAVGQAAGGGYIRLLRRVQDLDPVAATVII